MEYSTEKKQYTVYILLGAAFLAIGAAVVFFLIILPNLNNSSTLTPDNSTVTDNSNTNDTDDETDSEDSSTDDIFGNDEDTSEDEEVIDEETVTETDEETEEEELPDTSESDFTPAQTAPSWQLTKTATMECADEAGNLSDVTYVVTLKNTGSASGVISEVIDSLETIVLTSMLSSISGSGEYNETTHQLTWDNGGSGYTLAAGISQTFTYTVRFDKRLGQFTSVENDVTATPGDGSIPPSPAQSVVTVGCDIPDTALGDEEWLLPIISITATLLVLSLIEVKFAAVSTILGEDRVDSIKLALGSKESKKIVEKRMLRRRK